MPQPAKLNTTMATSAMPTQMAMVRMGTALPPLPELPPPRNTGALKAMINLPLDVCDRRTRPSMLSRYPLPSASSEARASRGGQQRDRPDERHAQPRHPAARALGLALGRIQVARSGRERQHDEAEDPDDPDQAQNRETHRDPPPDAMPPLCGAGASL